MADIQRIKFYPQRTYLFASGGTSKLAIYEWARNIIGLMATKSRLHPGLKLHRSITDFFKRLRHTPLSTQLAGKILESGDERNRFIHDFDNALLEALLLERSINNYLESFFNDLPDGSGSHEDLHDKMTALRSSLMNLRKISKDVREPVAWTSSFPKENQETSLINIFEFVQDLSKPYLSSGIFISNEIDPEKFIETKETSLRSIISNLLRNAVKAVRQSNRIDKRIRFDNQSFEDICSIFIEDNGCGILPHFQTVIWEKSFSGFHQGNGFGLYSSKQSVEAVGGKISLEYSEVSFGTIFRIDLPCSQVTVHEVEASNENKRLAW